MSQSDKLILFDIDGTLVHTGGSAKRAFRSAFIEIFNIDAVAVAGGKSKYAGMTDPNIFIDLAEGAGITPGALSGRYEQLVGSYLRNLEEEMRRPDPRRRVIEGVPELLLALESHRRTYLGLLTGNLEHGARLKLEPFGLNRFFPGGGFGSDDADRRIIAARAREKLTGQYGRDFNPEDTIVVGDTGHDIDCAHANGFKAVAVATGWLGPDRLAQAGPDFLFDTLENLEEVFGAFGLK